MRISFIDDEPEIFPLQYGGKARFIINMARVLAKVKDVEKVTILSSSINSESDGFEWKGISFKKLGGYDTTNQIIQEAAEADILSIHNCSVAFPAIKHPKAVLIYNLHDILMSNGDRGSHLDKALAGQWDALVAPSDFAAGVFRFFQDMTHNQAPVKVIPRPIDPDIFYPVGKEEAAKKIGLDRREGPIIFLPWRAAAGKGERFISILSGILGKNFDNYQILTTFSGNTELDNRRIRDLGWLSSEELPFYYSAADLTISFSMLPESFSQICVESIACGTPFLSFGYGNLTNLADKLPAAYTCAPQAEGIKTSLLNILNGNQADTISRSQAIIRRDFEVTTIAAAYTHWFKELIKLKSGNKNEPAITKARKRYLSSPLVVAYGNMAYLSTEEDIVQVPISDSQALILKECREPKAAEELILTNLDKDVKISSELAFLVEKKLIIES